jgi:hypothetical protein
MFMFPNNAGAGSGAHRTNPRKCSWTCDLANSVNHSVIHSHAELAAELKQEGLSFLTGVGPHPSGNWPGTHSSLLRGLALDPREFATL